MTSPDAFGRIRALFKSHNGPPDAAFSKQYAAILEAGRKSGTLTDADASLLQQMLRAFENWFSERPEIASAAFSDWLHLHDLAKARLPRHVLAAFLSRLPAATAKRIDWSSVVLEKADRDLLDLLIDTKVLKAPDVVRVAKAQPAKFYGTAGIDILLERHVPPPRAVWDTLDTLAERPPGLTPAAEAFADTFAVDHAVDAPGWLVTFLAQHSPPRTAIVLQLLRDPASFERLVNYLVTAAGAVRGKKKRVLSERIATVIPDVLRLCEQSVVENRRTAPTALFGLGMLLMAAHSSTPTFVPETQTEIEEVSGRIVRHRVLAVLRAAEEGRASETVPVVASVDDLYEAAQDYLRTLPTGGGSDTEPAERSARYQRYIGRKEVIQELLPILERLSDGRARSELDAALFNVGLRPLGVSEGYDKFDTHRHEATTPGIVPGDTVIIARPGWQLGDGEGAIVLSRARVKPQP